MSSRSDMVGHDMHRIAFNHVPKRLREFMAAGLALGLVVILALVGAWVFRGGEGSTTGSMWRLLLADRATLGFIRAAIVAVSLYAIASAAALLVSGRWIRMLGSRGFEADARIADEQLTELKGRYKEVKEERDRLRRLLRVTEHG